MNVTRRTFLKGLLGGAASALVVPHLPQLVVPTAEEVEAVTHRYWSLDRTQLRRGTGGLYGRVLINGVEVARVSGWAATLEARSLDLGTGQFAWKPTSLNVGGEWTGIHDDLAVVAGMYDATEVDIEVGVDVADHNPGTLLHGVRVDKLVTRGNQFELEGVAREVVRGRST